MGPEWPGRLGVRFACMLLNCVCIMVAWQYVVVRCDLKSDWKFALRSCVAEQIGVGLLSSSSCSPLLTHWDLKQYIKLLDLLIPTWSHYVQVCSMNSTCLEGCPSEQQCDVNHQRFSSSSWCSPGFANFSLVARSDELYYSPTHEHAHPVIG